MVWSKSLGRPGLTAFSKAVLRSGESWELVWSRIRHPIPRLGGRGELGVLSGAVSRRCAPQDTVAVLHQVDSTDCESKVGALVPLQERCLQDCRRCRLAAGVAWFADKGPASPCMQSSENLKHFAEWKVPPGPMALSDRRRRGVSNLQPWCLQEPGDKGEQQEAGARSNLTLASLAVSP